MFNPRRSTLVPGASFLQGQPVHGVAVERTSRTFFHLNQPGVSRTRYRRGYSGGRLKSPTLSRDKRELSWVRALRADPVITGVVARATRLKRVRGCQDLGVGEDRTGPDPAAIHPPAADSLGLAQTRVLQVEKPTVPRGCAPPRSAETLPGIAPWESGDVLPQGAALGEPTPCLSRAQTPACCSVPADCVAYSFPSRSSTRPARLCRARTTPTWFGRAPLHAAVISCCVLPVARARI
jgi:hypothetical protein